MSHLELIKQKIFEDADKLVQTVNGWRLLSDKIIFTNGCFDILHYGHICYLAEAADKGDRLIIGLNSDASVKKLKGKNRPVNEQIARAVSLAALRFVDAVIIFEEDTPYNLIKKIQPDVLVKGGDWKKEDIIGADVVEQNGGEVEVINFINGYSTTGIIEKIRSNS